MQKEVVLDLRNLGTTSLIYIIKLKTIDANKG